MRRRALIPVPPESAGGWIRRGLDTANAAAAPEPMHSLNARAWVRARYFREQMSVEVNAYGFEASAGALEAAQRWNPYDRATVILRGPVLVVCSSVDVSGEDLRTFAKTLEAAWFGSAR